MKRSVLLMAVALGMTLATGSQAKDVLGDKYFSVNTPAPLSGVDMKALKIAREHNKSVGNPMPGEWGSVEFGFGRGQATIVCAPLHVTDIALQPGETINSLQIGDAVRWSLEPMVSGGLTGDQVHIIVKPKDVGLETNLVVATNVRVYNLRLKSTRNQYLPSVTFSYPEIAQEKFRMAQEAKFAKEKRETIPETGERLGDLDFEYAVDGVAAWKPIRVYNNGVKTYIDMPSAIKAQDVPTLLVLKDEGGLFSEDDVEIINYRYQKNRFIVDGVPKQIILISGVGGNQERITLTRETKSQN